MSIRLVCIICSLIHGVTNSDMGVMEMQGVMLRAQIRGKTNSGSEVTSGLVGSLDGLIRGIEGMVGRDVKRPDTLGDIL